MTQEEVREQVIPQIDKAMREAIFFTKVKYGDIMVEEMHLDMTKAHNQILSIPEILIKAPDQSLPHIPEKDVDGLPIGSWLVSAGIFAQQDILKSDNGAVFMKVLVK